MGGGEGVVSDKHGPRFVVPSQGGRTRGVRAGDVRGEVRAKPPGQPAGPHGARDEQGGGEVGPEGRFQALFEHAPLGAALSAMDGRFTDVNRSLRDLLAGTGIDPDHGGLADLARNLPEGSDEARAWRDELADVRAGRIPVAQAELAVAPPDGRPRWLRATTALIVLGQRRYLLSHVEDTTGDRLAEPAGLPTGVLLGDRLAAALARDTATGLHTGMLTVGIDDVRCVADLLGVGVDAVLAAVSGRLAGLLRAGDTVGHLDGQVLAVIAPDLPDEVALGQLVQRIDAGLADPLDVGRFRRRVTATVGAALARPGDTVATALQRADRVMADVRRTRRTEPIDVRETDLRETDLRQTDLRETDLRGADGHDGDGHERPA